MSRENHAKEMLEQISYYSLISGYKEPFKHAASENYKHGVTFEEIVALYYFDEELRTLFLKYILHVGRHLKSMISYYFCERYGEQQQAYLNPNNYALTPKNAHEVNKLVYSIQKTISLPSRYTYITHHVNKYHNIPLWVTMNALTFGQVSKIYQYIPNEFAELLNVSLDDLMRDELNTDEKRQNIMRSGIQALPICMKKPGRPCRKKLSTLYADIWAGHRIP